MAAVSLQSLVYSIWPDFYQYKQKIQNSDETKGKICSSPTNCTNKNQFIYKVMFSLFFENKPVILQHGLYAIAFTFLGLNLLFNKEAFLSAIYQLFYWWLSLTKTTYLLQNIHLCLNHLIVMLYIKGAFSIFAILYMRPFYYVLKKQNRQKTTGLLHLTGRVKHQSQSCSRDKEVYFSV